MDYPEDLTPLERGAKIATALQAGRMFTVSGAADYLGVTYQGARYVLMRVARVLPVYADYSERPAKWCWIGPEGRC